MYWKNFLSCLYKFVKVWKLSQCSKVFHVTPLPLENYFHTGGEKNLRTLRELRCASLTRTSGSRLITMQSNGSHGVLSEECLIIGLLSVQCVWFWWFSLCGVCCKPGLAGGRLSPLQMDQRPVCSPAAAKSEPRGVSSHPSLLSPHSEAVDSGPILVIEWCPSVGAVSVNRFRCTRTSVKHGSVKRN